MQLTKNFHLDEFVPLHLKGKPVAKAVLANLKLLALELQALRDKWGRPIVITSGYRPPDYNKAVGGVPERPDRPGSGSKHLYGLAADIVVPGLSPKQVQQLLKDWKGGLGCYATFTHIDLGKKRRW